MRETPLEYTDIVFNAKPDAVPYNYRISYKVTQLCLIMRICGRGDVCSLIKLHLISFALISQENILWHLRHYRQRYQTFEVKEFDETLYHSFESINDI